MQCLVQVDQFIRQFFRTLAVKRPQISIGRFFSPSVSKKNTQNNEFLVSLTQLRLSSQRLQFPGMASRLSYQRNVCCPDIGDNRQSARVSTYDISQRLGHTCCQDYTSAKKQIQRFAGLSGRN